MKVHGFHERLAEGQRAEHFVVKSLNKLYRLNLRAIVTIQQQKSGVDFVDSKGRTYELKTDWRAGDTGNVFLETWSQFENDVKGWAHTCQANWLLYYFAHDGLISIHNPRELRYRLLPKWEKKYKETKAYNASYSSRGLLVPRSMWILSAARVINIGPLPRNDDL